MRELDVSRTWIHVDMDMFYAAVSASVSLITLLQIEIRNNPELEGKPVAVGDVQMIQTANYIARKFGVKSGLPGFIAKKLCPDLQFVKPNMDQYKQVS